MFSWKRRERDLEREIRSHLELELEEQRESGLSPGEARHAARRAFGNATLIAENTRSAWGWIWIESIGKDLRFALRMLRKNPGFSAIAVLALALGIGVNTTVFTVVNAVLLRPLPFHHPEQLVKLWDSYGVPGNAGPVSYPNFVDWRAWNRTFSDMAAFTGYSAVLTGSGEPLHVDGVIASASLLPMLGAQPILGRNFVPEEDIVGRFTGANRIILGYGLWRDHFGGDRSILGRTLVLDGRPYSVIGVMPAGFDARIGIAHPDFWMTAASLAEPSSNGRRRVTEERQMSFLSVIGRRKAGTSASQAQADMDRVASLLVKSYPDDDPKEGVLMQGLQESGSSDHRTTLLLLLSAAGVVFIIACADVGGLVVARSMRRQREMTLRAALGAGRWRIVRQLLAESLVLAELGGIVGVGLAGMTGQVLAKWLSVDTLGQATVDPKVLGFAFLAATLAAAAFSLTPAIHTVKTDLIDGLKESALSTSETRRQKVMHSALVVGQIALAMVMLSASAILTLSLLRLQNTSLGFEAAHVLTFPVSLPAGRYQQSQRAAFFLELMERLRSVPGVESAGAAGNLPLHSGISRTVIDRISGKDIALRQRSGIVYASATPQYFRAMKIAVTRGREFTIDDTASSQPVVIINEAAARQYFGKTDPVGQQIEPVMWNGSGSPLKMRTIVGVVANLKTQNVRFGAFPAIYWPVTQIPSDATMFVSVRTPGDPASLAAGVRTTLHSLDPDLPLYDAQPLDRIVGESLSSTRDTATLVCLFALLSLSLTAVGLYGVIAYSVARRTREIGVRIALGARPGELLRSVVMRGLFLGLTGVAIGAPASIAAARIYRTLLYQVSPQEPIALVTGAVVMILVAMAASFLPARRASRVDPMVALRYQ